MRDGKNNEPLVGASIYINDLEAGESTDNNGKYEINLPGGIHVLTFSNVNYEEKIVDLEIYEDGELQMNLMENPILLDEEW